MLKINYSDLFHAFIQMCEKDPLYKVCININNTNKGQYKYIPSRPDTIKKVLYHLSTIKTELKDLTFTDAGCGYPLLLKIMSIFGCNTQGIESNPVICALFPELLEDSILKFDFKKSDIIYAYHPLTDSKMMQTAITNIMSTMKIGAIFYFAYASNNLPEFQAQFPELKEIGYSNIFYYQK